jgi:hypothetical protein
MRKLLAVTAAALLAASTGALACSDYETSASVTPAEELGLAQPPAPAKVPAATVAKVSTPKAAKPAVAKEKTAIPQSDQKLVVYRN